MRYISPIAKMAMMPAFRLGPICRCHVAQMGSKRFSRSENTLTAPDAINEAFLLMQ